MSGLNLSRRNALCAAASFALSAPAAAQTKKTSNVVKILVGFPAGQATDTVARLLADKLRAITGDTYIVDNVPGQGGSIAMGQLAKSRADGSVMMLAHMSAVATNPHLYKSISYDSMKDFEAIGLLGDLPFALVCHPSQPFADIRDLIRFARAKPGQLSYASSGYGTVSHLAMEEFKRRADIDLLHVPYKGSSTGLTDVIAGQVSLALQTVASALPFVQSGKLRVLGMTTAKRLSVAPNVPTVAEQGFDGFTAATWLMLIYPAGTSQTQVASTFAAMSKAMHDPDVEQKLQQLGALPRSSVNPTEAAAYMRSEYARWGEVVKRSGIKQE